MKWKLPVLALALGSATLFGGAITRTDHAAHAAPIPDDVKIGGFRHRCTSVDVQWFHDF